MRYRVTKYTHSLVQVTEGCFTIQYIKSTTRSRISIERVVSRCNSVAYGHLLIDLIPKTVDSLRYCSNSGSVTTKLYLPAGIETRFLDEGYTKHLYSPNISKICPKALKTIHSQLSRRFHSESEREFSKPIKRRASRSSDKRRSKISKRYFRTNPKKNSSTQKKN